MESITQSIKDTFHDRVSSPLYGTYLISWIFFNYQVPIIIFSNIKPDEKIILLTDYFHGFSHISIPYSNITFGFPTCITYGLIIPALMTYLFVFQISKLSYIFHKRAMELKKEKRIAEMQNSEEQWIDPEKHKKLRATIYSQQAEIDRLKDEKKKQGDFYISEIKTLTTDLDLEKNNRQKLNELTAKLSIMQSEASKIESIINVDFLKSSNVISTMKNTLNSALHEKDELILKVKQLMDENNIDQTNSKYSEEYLILSMFLNNKNQPVHHSIESITRNSPISFNQTSKTLHRLELQGLITTTEKIGNSNEFIYVINEKGINYLNNIKHHKLV